MSQTFETAADLADALLNAVGKNIVLGLPVGIGKAIHVADALFERAAADRSISLTIFTGLTLEAPQAGSDLERRLLEPIVERLYADWPTARYATALRKNQLPPNVQVREFYLRPGAFLGNPAVQQSYTSVNYSHVVSTLLDLGANVIAQLVASHPNIADRYSLGSNPEVTLDLLPRLEERRQAGQAVAMVGQVNRNMPYMRGDAELPRHRFDFVLDGNASNMPLFPLPNRSVSAADYATAMHVASLVPDGGTLQIGIGSLSDAVAHCLRLRHEWPDVFSDVLSLLPGGSASTRRGALPIESRPFREGLFASTELLSDALYSLFDCGIIRRPADEHDPSVVHAGFFIGSNRLYDSLRTLEESRRALIRMTSISHVNTLFGDEKKKRQQRRQARFVNETMMATALGSAVSDALEDGRVVSGVGGQFDFVSMAHSLEDSQSILMVRAQRRNKGILQSNIRWSYAHSTVPRHHRDVFVSEYGVAATRGQTDRQIIDSMIGIADIAFQKELIQSAMAAGKLEADYPGPIGAEDNTAEALQAIFDQESLRDYFPQYPLGTDLTKIEQRLIVALEWLELNTATPLSKLRSVGAAIAGKRSCDHENAIARMGLDKTDSLRERLTRRMLELALQRTDR